VFSLESIHDGLRLNWLGKTLLNYCFATGGQRPYWHPLQLPYAPSLTMNEPRDHVHHQGMWFAWKNVNGVNFWEQGKPEADPAGFGKIAHQCILEQSTDDAKAAFVTENAWIDWQGATHLTEIRRTTIFPPQADCLFIDLELQFKPHRQEVTLHLNRGTPGEGGCFYSGLIIRFYDAMRPGHLDADGREETTDIFGKQSRWCGFGRTHAQDSQV